MLFTGDSEEEAALDEMEEVTHPNQLSDSEHMSHCMYVLVNISCMYSIVTGPHSCDIIAY